MSAAFESPDSLRPLLDEIALCAASAGLGAYIVGGTVRDVLLGRPVHDLDLAVDRDALALGRQLSSALDGHFVELDDLNAVARVVLRQPRGSIGYIDVAQLQGSLDDDLRRRDFTIDALAVALDVAGLSSTVHDITGGLNDLRAGLVRMTSTAVFDHDPLRLLRAARLAAELHFTIESGTEAEVRRRARDVLAASAERHRDELARIFALDDAHGALRLLDRLGLLDALLPELTAGRGVSQPPQWHAYDVLEHAFRAVEAMDIMLAPSPPSSRAWIWQSLWSAFVWCEAELRAYLGEHLSEGRPRASLLKIAALLHDVAKPRTRSVDADGRVHFYGHADEGAIVAARVLRRLRFSAAEVRLVSTLVAEHLRPVQLAQVGQVPTRRALYRFYRALGDGVPAVLFLALADALASRGPNMTSEGWARHVAYMNSLLVRSREEPGIVQPPRFLTGDDIMRETGLPAGPAIGRLIEELREAQAAGEILDAGQARDFVRRLAAEHTGEG
jgi:tRNA nucleotidyltransferase/poly(A) polymerase